MACGLKRKRIAMRSDAAPGAEAKRPKIMCEAKASDQALPASSSTDADAALLKGSAPSPAEWKDAWAELSETTSLRKMGRVAEKKAGTSGGGGGRVCGADSEAPS